MTTSREMRNDAEESVGLLLEDFHKCEGDDDDGPKEMRGRPYKTRLGGLFYTLIQGNEQNRLRVIKFGRCFWHIARPEWAVPSQKRQLYATSWLDGVRGLAALFVVLHHCSRYVTELRDGMVFDFAHLLSLPIVSVVVAGTSMVDVFFVVSGYCLSYKALCNARAGEHGRLFQDLSSSAFRRSIRLFLPCFAMSFVWALLSYIGYNVRAPHESTFLKQLYHWMYDFIQGISPYRVVTNTGAFAFGDVHWTIPVEFRGSLHIFLSLLALGRAKTHVRLIVLTMVQVYLSLTGRWDILLFNSGMLCCELRLIQQSWESTAASNPMASVAGQPSNDTVTPNASVPAMSGSQPWIYIGVTRSINIVFFLFVLFLLAMQHTGHDFGWFDPIYAPFQFRSPDSWIHAEPGEMLHGAGRPIIVLGAVLLIVQVDLFFPQLKSLIFERRFPQYLGDISYSIYLVHSPLLDTIGNSCFATPWNAFYNIFLRHQEGAESHVDFRAMKLLVWMFCLTFVFGPILCWVSDLFLRYVDQGCIRLAKRVEKLCFKT